MTGRAARFYVTSLILAFTITACTGTSASPAESDTAADSPSSAPESAADASAPESSADTSAAPTLSPEGESVEIRALTGFGENQPLYYDVINQFVEAVEAGANGRITFTVDGPDVVPITEQLTAVQTGVYDMVYTVGSFYSGVVPEGEALFFISGDSSCQEYRDAGALEAFQEAHIEKANAFMLACAGGGAHGATFLLTEPVSSIDEFEGMVFRGFGVYNIVLEELGASTVAMPAPEVYGAVETGVVDGSAYPNLGIVEQGLHEVLPYIVMPPWLPFRYGFFMNVDSFDEMPRDIQEYLQRVAWDLESQFDEYWVEQRDAEAVQLEELGVTEIFLPDDEHAHILDLVYDGLWGSIRELSPEHGPAMQEQFESVEPAP
jgi:TRAP-type transport system periplasmic protein